MAYKLLHEAAKKRTEHFVVETAVDTDDSVKARLPDELIEMMQLPTNDENVSV
jgi:E3 ubiquitin-protein ligase listerin